MEQGSNPESELRTPSQPQGQVATQRVPTHFQDPVTNTIHPIYALRDYYDKQGNMSRRELILQEVPSYPHRVFCCTAPGVTIHDPSGKTIEDFTEWANEERYREMANEIMRAKIVPEYPAKHVIVLIERRDPLLRGKKDFSYYVRSSNGGFMWTPPAWYEKYKDGYQQPDNSIHLECVKHDRYYQILLREIHLPREETKIDWEESSKYPELDPQLFAATGAEAYHAGGLSEEAQFSDEQTEVGDSEFGGSELNSPSPLRYRGAQPDSGTIISSSSPTKWIGPGGQSVVSGQSAVRDQSVADGQFSLDGQPAAGSQLVNDPLIDYSNQDDPFISGQTATSGLFAEPPPAVDDQDNYVQHRGASAIVRLGDPITGNDVEEYAAQKEQIVGDQPGDDYMAQGYQIWPDRRD